MRFLFLAFLFLGSASVARAHDPQIVFPQATAIHVADPNRSTAYYSELFGEPQEFKVIHTEKAPLSVELLIPVIDGYRTDFSFYVERVEGEGRVLESYHAATTTAWRPFYEPWGGDDYLTGPHYEAELPAGEYLITVTSPDNVGKYVLSVGTEEKMTMEGAFHMLLTLPALKAYMEKSPTTAFFNRAGAVVGGAILGSILALWGIYRVVRRFRR